MDIASFCPAELPQSILKAGKQGFTTFHRLGR
jgi:hypothetical protein